MVVDCETVVWVVIGVVVVEDGRVVVVEGLIVIVPTHSPIPKSHCAAAAQSSRVLGKSSTV